MKRFFRVWEEAPDMDRTQLNVVKVFDDISEAFEFAVQKNAWQLLHVTKYGRSEFYVEEVSPHLQRNGESVWYGRYDGGREDFSLSFDVLQTAIAFHEQEDKK